MFGLVKAILDSSLNGGKLRPQISTSAKYKHWVSFEDFRRCLECEKNHGKIWRISEIPKPSPLLHINCRCKIEPMKTITAGTSTIDGINGADWYIKNYGTLPNNYITVDAARLAGWEPGKWPSNFIPDKMIVVGIYNNRNGHLPESNNRIWYEADINYRLGKRNGQRILWSNDGLVFVTYDHYKTFFEIV